MIEIDESKCNGCGLCVKACHEGALALVDGKAKLVRPNFCDGMGDCLPACPMDAISFKEETPSNVVKMANPILVQSSPNMISVPGEQWPIQLALVSPSSDFLKGTLIVGADCTAFKVENFKQQFVGKNPLVIGCPKLDDRSRFDKLLEMFRNNPIDKVKVIRMEVPCCSQLTKLVQNSIKESGKDIEVEEIVIGRNGKKLSNRATVSDNVNLV
jgi:NAD-dependent dihydropyrimidine dehydrogenase PreA subunit